MGILLVAEQLTLVPRLSKRRAGLSAAPWRLSNGADARVGGLRILRLMWDAALQPLRALVEANRDQIKAVVARHKGRAVAVFGSVARGEETQESDVDFLVEFEPGSSLFDLADLEDALASLLGRRVDVVSLGGLKLRDRQIRQDARWL
jgi:predicted nucleotidyltransferase